MKILITGANGFIGGRLLESLYMDPLSPDQELIPLTRNASKMSTKFQWRSCDLYSLRQAEEATVNCDIGIYLVHSMLPSARLNQASFEDTDLILADNFARACKKNGVKRIIYLGGLIPDVPVLSAHLRSRLEVESALAAYGARVISLRAGLILGAEGSSFQIICQLVKKLPILVCPEWTKNLTQPIAVPDAIALLRYAIANDQLIPGPYDIGGPDVLSYQELMNETGKALGLKRTFVEVPLFSPGLSLLWVQLITGASKNLISPLVQSLKYKMIVRNDTLMKLSGIKCIPLSESLKLALRDISVSLRTSTKSRKNQLSKNSEVRSIQRLPLPAGRSAEWVAHEYFRWLPRRLSPLIRVQQSTSEYGTEVWTFTALGFSRSLLELTEAKERSVPDRKIWMITGGILLSKHAKKNARLEFREVLAGSQVLAAIHDFKPRLAWPIYKFSQALAHSWVMSRFRSHLNRL